MVSSLASESLNASLTAEQKKLYSGLTTLGVSAAGKAAEYTMYAAGSFVNGGGFASAYDNMGGLTVNIANLGAMLDIVSCGIARNNSTGQSSLGKYAEALKGTGLLEVTFGSSGITGRIGTGGIDLGGSLYDFGKRMNDVNSLRKYEAEFGAEKGQAAYNAYIYGDWTVENTAARLASKRDELIFTAGTDYKAHTTQNTAGTGRIIEMNNLGDKYNNAITLGHEAYRNGIVDNNNKKETLDAVLSHIKMADAMKDDMKKAGIGFDKQLAIEVALYNMGVLDIEKLAEDYDSSADYWKMTWGGQLINDGQGWLVDEDGMYINIDGSRSEKPEIGKTLGAGKLDKEGNPIVGATGNIETGLLNIISNSSNEKYTTFTDKQIKAVQALMTGANTPIEPINPDADFKKFQWGTKKGQKLNMYNFMETAGSNVNQEIFKTYYNNTVDSQISKLLGVDLGFYTDKEIPLNQYTNYISLATNYFIDYLQSDNAKQTLYDKYFQTITNENGESTKLYKLDKNNPFIDKIYGQHDFKGLTKNDSIDNSGCNFMTIVSVPQLLTGTVFEKSDVLDIWNTAISIDKNYINQEAWVNNRSGIAELALNKTNLNGKNIHVTINDKTYKDYNKQQIGNRITWLNNSGTPYHYSLGSNNSVNIYNPGYTIKPSKTITAIDLWWK